MPTLYSPSKKYFNRNDSSFHGGPRRASFSSSKKKLSLLGPFGSLSLSVSPRPNLLSQDTLPLSNGSFVPPSLSLFRFQFLPDFAEFRPKGFRFYLPRPPRVLASFCSLEFYARGYTLDFAEFRRPPSFFRIISSSRPHRTRARFLSLSLFPRFSTVLLTVRPFVSSLRSRSNSSRRSTPPPPLSLSLSLSRELWTTLFLLASSPLFSSSSFFSLLFIY